MVLKYIFMWYWFHKDIADVFNIDLIKVYRCADASADYFVHKVNLLNHQVVDVFGEILIMTRALYEKIENSLCRIYYTVIVP